MPLTTPDYIQQHRIASTSLQKSGFPAVQTVLGRSKHAFSAVLDQVQGACRGVSQVGKKCLAVVNPVNHTAALYRIAQAGLHPDIENADRTTEEKLAPLTIPMDDFMQDASAAQTVREDMRESETAENGFSRLGVVAARYESGSLGIAAVGYDRNGGTSYGIYQLSSRAGTMSRFIDYLREHAPRWAERLSACGPANTGSANGRMPREWKKIAAEDPDRLAQLQYDFIRKSHYDEALTQVQEQTGINLSQRSAAVQEAVWSTAVQHGPRGAADIVSRALTRATRSDGTVSDERLIHEIYSSRSRSFKSSTRRVRAAVQQRFSEEKRVVLAMLKNGKDVQSA